jgi:DNA polymerase II
VIKAFLLTRQWIDSPNGINLEFWFNSDQGPLNVIIQNQQAIFFIHQQDTVQAQHLISRFSGSLIKNLELKSFKYKQLSGVYFQSQQHLYRARDIFQKNNIQIFESDIRPTERFLTERFITGPVSIHTQTKNTPYINPRLTATDYQPKFKIMSIDIETAYDNDSLFSIAFVTEEYNRTLIIGHDKNTETIEYIADEKILLKRFMEWVKVIDPDVFIGWNVINFDFRFLQKKADQLKTPLTIGRNNSLAIWRKAQTETKHYFLLIPGRVVLDGIDTLKSATYQFRSFSLEFVGNQLLGRGKLIQQEYKNNDPLYKAKEIKNLFHNNKAELAAYNLEDCQLVWDIFEMTNLIEFAIERARLTGLEMDRTGGSVAAFDNLYLPRLHRKGFIAPNIGDYSSQLSAPGGYVMNSRPGIYDSVLVLDYKSLYPSIIRTFKVDPYARIAAKQQSASDIIPGFDGATFSKEENILPEIIEQLWKARDEAKKQSNKALSQAIKIIMNSFYGVLGTAGCRLHDARLTSSITKRSHEIIKQTVKIIENKGYPVIYGDTDSVFVSLEKETNNSAADEIGKSLIADINLHWKTYLDEKHGIPSYLEMEYETHFNRFFMPTVRGSDKGSKKRYAGLIINNNGDRNITFKGLETVRTDWTELARNFQAELFKLIFNDQDYKEYIKKYVTDLKEGKMDESLIYRKRLRQRLKDYQKNIPPHAQAAIKAEAYFSKSNLPSRYKNASWIEYAITNNGPETLEHLTSPLNYEHYIEKQLTPIANNILNALGASIEPIIQNQYDLF